MSQIATTADLDSLERVVGGEDEYAGAGYEGSGGGGYDATYEESAYAGQSSGYSSGSDPTYEESAYAGQSSGYSSGSDPTYEESAYAGQSSGYSSGSDPTYEESAYAGQANGYPSPGSNGGFDPTYEESAYAGQSTGYSSPGSNDGYDQVAGLIREDGAPLTGPSPAPTLLGQSTQRFDDGTSLTTYDWNTGTVLQTNNQQVQMFDDGSRLVTDNYSTRTLGSSAAPDTTSRTWSVDSLDSRLNSSDLGYFLDHPATATQTDIFTAEDVMRNYEDRLPYYARDGLNDYINGYYTGTAPPAFGGLPPTPTPRPGLYPNNRFG